MREHWRRDSRSCRLNNPPIQMGDVPSCEGCVESFVLPFLVPFCLSAPASHPGEGIGPLCGWGRLIRQQFARAALCDRMIQDSGRGEFGREENDHFGAIEDPATGAIVTAVIPRGWCVFEETKGLHGGFSLCGNPVGAFP